MKIPKNVAKYIKNNKYINKPKEKDDFHTIEDSLDYRKKWYEDIQEKSEESEKVTDQQLIDLKEEAQKFYNEEILVYNLKKNKSKSSYSWINTVLTKGTASDKLAANVILIQDNPICGLNILRNMVCLVKAGKKKECIMAIDTLTELFLNDLLRPNMKLKSFGDKPLGSLAKLSSGNNKTRKNYLIVWYFENELKEIYYEFVQALNQVAHDTIETNKEKAIVAMFKLLSGNPEQEQNLLSHLVNKLGDPSSKLSSKVIYCLTKLLTQHQDMKQVVLKEIEKLLYRSNISTKAQYYSICFLSQYYLSKDDFEVANCLVSTYFGFFNACVKKGDIDSRMMSALLMGVNRAVPYSKLDLNTFEKHINTMYKVVNLSNFNIAIHALNLLFQISQLSHNVNDRFYCSLYRKIIDPRIHSSSHQAILLSLIFKSLKIDKNFNRVICFIKRLLQIALHTSVPMACGILFLISQLTRKKPALLKLVHKGIKDEKSKNEKVESIEEDSDVEQKPDIDQGILLANTFAKDVTVEDDQNVEQKPILKPFYDPYVRNPSYAGGQFAVYGELVLLQEHFHPTVALFSKQLVNGEIIKYSGDPLKDFQLIRFLDRFVFKNPKKSTGIDDSKCGYHFKFGQRKSYVPLGLRSLPIKSRTYLKEAAKNIPKEELFMYEFLQKRQKFKEVKEEENESDNESVASEEFEEMIGKMYGGIPKDDGDSDEDLDYLKELGDSLKKDGKNKNKRRRDEDLDEFDNDDIEQDDESQNGDFESQIEDDDFEIQDNDDDDNQTDDEMGNDENEGSENLDDDDDEFDDLFVEDDFENLEEDIALKKSKKKKQKSLDSLFMSADEFSMMLEKNANRKSGTSNQWLNNDQSVEKQLKWEEKRDRWIKDKGRKNKKGLISKKKKSEKSFSNDKKKPGTKRKKNFKPNSKSKKIKK